MLRDLSDVDVSDEHTVGVPPPCKLEVSRGAAQASPHRRCLYRRFALADYELWTVFAPFRVSTARRETLSRLCFVTSSKPMPRPP